VVLNNRNYDEGKSLIVEQNWEKEVAVCIGVEEAGLGVVRVETAGDCDLVVIQDGARPMVTSINRSRIRDGERNRGCHRRRYRQQIRLKRRTKK